MKEEKREEIFVGIDIGSTTTKMEAITTMKDQILFSSYKRHHANQVESVLQVLKEFQKKFSMKKIKVALTGSGSKPMAEAMKIPFIQEVAANATALKKKYSFVNTAIELGGQDAKMIFFKKDSKNGEKSVSDMRMNGSCAGGTGAFIDEIASVLKVPVEKFNQLAEKGKHVYDISGRCGVYAKTDIQPLLNQGVSKEDLALSAFHAIAKQTIGGLAQGLEIEKPVAFEGGPLTFNPTLVQVFAQRLHLSKEEVIRPQHPELMVAFGAAKAIPEMFPDCKEVTAEKLIHRLEEKKEELMTGSSSHTKPFFVSEEEKQAFENRHKKKKRISYEPKQGEIVYGYLGMDAGSTTTKFVILNEKEEMLDSFYAPNEGDPLLVASQALIKLRQKYEKAGACLKILSAGTTGYGEMLFSKAFGIKNHTVETVAHAKASEKYRKDASFILDIGGQDMKAIWLDHGIITNILLNEACSSGCGSFLENFASSLHIPTKQIAQAAFSSKHPAALGSRCTVFMNSSIITEQRNGKTPQDIMAGLCRSIIENVFTKVIRISNLDSLGKKIIVQGGTFENDAVLRVMEEYIGREVIRAPYPGMMGAIGAALFAKEQYAMEEEKEHPWDLKDLDYFSYKQEANAPCPFCGNHCQRTIVTFSNGNFWVTNNRCERGEIIGDPKNEETAKRLKEKMKEKQKVANLFDKRESLLFMQYPYPQVSDDKNITIGIPRVLSFWETMPFWTTFLGSLGFKVVISDKSTREMYENGLSAVTSDTVCFPAKLVHGHIRNLAQKGVDRIFMPSITTVPPENNEKTSESMCAIVKGYPIVIKNSDHPSEKWGIPYDAPLFHWHTLEDRNKQLIFYMEKTFSLEKKEIKKALSFADAAQEHFHRELKEEGRKVLKEIEEKNQFAVVLAARPYQNDSLVNHDLPKMFTNFGIPVLTADSLPQVNETDLKKSRLDIVNNFHARMLSSAILAAKSNFLEYVQFVSFGCGHDAYLSDEIIRMMKEISKKTPLILKMDESDIQGPMGIRVRSFLETIRMKRAKGYKSQIHALENPYPIKFTKESRKKRIALVPNTSHAFCRLMSAALKTQGIEAVPLDMGREDAIRLGKQYVHNDICFPAQIVIGEALAALKSGKYDGQEVAVVMGKYIGDCRLTHYGALLRKALDDAGYENVPILTNDDVDSHKMHPGFKMNLLTSARIAFTLPMIDILEELLRKIRPYEIQKGSADAAFEKAMNAVIYGLESSGISGVKKGFKKAIHFMNQIPYDRSNPKPQVLIVGEYLLNFHSGANHDIEAYLEQNGFEIIEARMTDVIRKTYFYQDAQIKEYHLQKPLNQKIWYRTANELFEMAHRMADSIAIEHPLYKPTCTMKQLVKDSDPVIHHTFDAGEGVLIPGEIIHHAKHGCRFFLILQPFGCLPNHVVGRGITKKLKEMFPNVQILPLDYDPDVSFANIENRLQMLVMNAKNQRENEEKNILRKENTETAPVGDHCIV